MYLQKTNVKTQVKKTPHCLPTKYMTKHYATVSLSPKPLRLNKEK